MKRVMRRLLQWNLRAVERGRFAIASALWLGSVAAAVAQSSFVNFENPPVHPIDLSPSRDVLAVANLPDNRAEIFDLTPEGSPVHRASIPVGLDPVSVRFRTDDELWVVNHISDSVSIVDLAAGRVVATLQTLDEPADVVFAGSAGRGFVSCSQVNTIQVFDSAARVAVGQIAIDGEDPRALARSADGMRVYAAIFESGNATTLLGGGNRRGIIPNVVNDPTGPYGGQNPPPNAGASFDPPINPALPAPPPVALIVRKNASGQWMDDNNGDWTDWVTGATPIPLPGVLSGHNLKEPGWDMPDRDLAIIDADTLGVIYATGLMNICMAVGVNPATGFVSVVGTDAINEVRFEPKVNGIFVRVQHASIDPGNPENKTVGDLNPHLDYSSPTIAASERAESIGDPRAIVWNAAGTRGYVAGMGSNNVIVIDAAGARADAGEIGVGQGPSGLAIDDARGRLYVMNRFGASVSVIDLVGETVIESVGYYDPTPETIRAGRPHFYNTQATSGLGQASCASCHVDGRMDRLAWDLGDPSGEVKLLEPISDALNDGQHNLGANQAGLNTGFEDFHPMKGPMVTQTFQGIIGAEPLHWRGDRDGLEEFNGAFLSLMGDDEMLTPEAMQEFEDFVATITFPPNPYRNFDNTLPNDLNIAGHYATGRHALPRGAQLPNGNAVTGLARYRGDGFPNLDGFSCVQCHTLPTGMSPDSRQIGGVMVPIPPGPMGERHLALQSADSSTNRAIKVPHLRNLYDKVGFEYTQSSSRAGFGYFNDGMFDSLAGFVSSDVFGVTSDQAVADLVAFMLAFSGSDLPEGSPNDPSEPPGPPSPDAHAAVGKQVTIASPDPVAMFGYADAVAAMIALADPDSSRVDLVARGSMTGVPRGWYYDRDRDRFQSDHNAGFMGAAELIALAAPGNELTFTVVPRGSGPRIGVDRDEDGFYDYLEMIAGSDPADPDSIPGAGVLDWERYR